MTLYYLCTRPENIVALVISGHCDAIPSYITTNELQCQKQVENCIITSPHQTFILVLQIPDHEEEELIFEEINPAWIQGILLYSERSEKLLRRLLPEECFQDILIELNPALFPTNVRKRSPSFFEEQTPTTPPPSKTIRTDFFQGLSNQTVRIPKEGAVEKQLPIYIDRLTTLGEHLYCLNTAVAKAKYKILMTSFSINHETFISANLYATMSEAVRRGVRVYIYYNIETIPDRSVVRFFAEHQIFCEPTCTHTKILAIDNHTIVAGSFNWLSAIDQQGYVSEESSIAIQSHSVCPILIEDVWRYLKSYRALQLGSIWSFIKFEQETENRVPEQYFLGDDTDLIYLATFEQQMAFFRSCFEKARKRVIICSPFISSTQSYQEDMTLSVLYRTLRRKVDVFIICNSNTEEYERLSQYIGKTYSAHIQLIGMENIHLKTIIIDDHMIAEGSFNWLSAARYKQNLHHNHEQVLLFKGERASELIENFYQSRVGAEVIKRAEEVQEAIEQEDGARWCLIL